LKLFISIAVAASGLIHLWIAPEHYGHAPVHGIFFVAAGIGQLAWAYLFYKKPTAQLYYAGLVLTGGLTVLWALTRVSTQPFHGHVGEVEIYGILSKTAEIAGLVGLTLMGAQGAIKGVHKSTIARALAAAFLLSVFAGDTTYAVALAAERVLAPASGDHAGEGEHGHEEGEEHGHEEEGEEYDE
jgi:hypothetical protein